MATPEHYERAPAAADGRARIPRPYYVLRNPFDRWTTAEMRSAASRFAMDNEMSEYQDYFIRGGMLNLDPGAFRSNDLKLTDAEKRALELEYSPSSRWDRFRHTKGLYTLVILCSAAAAVQGWDESAVNGAQVFYSNALSIDPQSFEYGLVNSAPYLCCIFSCLLTYPLNYLLGRRWTIFVTCSISFAACLGQAFVQSWQTLFVARLILGLGIGPKSATVPIYSAECAPANVRGALVMMWQMWTAFGIMLGYAAGAVFHNVAGSGSHFSAKVDESDNLVFFHSCGESNDAGHLRTLQCSWNWRLMLASPMVLPIVVFLYVLWLPESPRWLLGRAHMYEKRKDSRAKRYYERALQSLIRLRHTKLQAARDLFLIHHELSEFENIQGKKKPFTQLFTEGRSRRALVASVTCMFFQQFCGVNIMAYYSTTVLLRAGYEPTSALLASLGFGIINWIFAIPAFWTIDTFGRRSLLLSTFPFMALFHALIAIPFAVDPKLVKAWSKTLVILGMYLFGVAYSPGEGPVPFVYAAESMPLYNRDIGMGIVTSINWGFNFLVAITWPKFVSTFSQAGAFAWYAAWCIVGELVILLIVPETKGLSLEKLTQVFEVPTKDHAKFGLRQASTFLQWCINRRRRLKMPELFGKPEEEGLEIIRHAPEQD